MTREVKVFFALEQDEDSYPPVRAESIWVQVFISINSLDNKLASKLEARAIRPETAFSHPQVKMSRLLSMGCSSRRERHTGPCRRGLLRRDAFASNFPRMDGPEATCSRKRGR